MKYILVLMLVLQNFTVVSQPKVNWTEYFDRQNELASELKNPCATICISLLNQEIIENEIEPIGITHNPSIDFNIYLTFNKKVTSGLRTSIDLSLNYVGIMNVRSVITLRGKQR
ncbi:hypothetical protein [Ekhidna sp.]